MEHLDAQIDTVFKLHGGELRRRLQQVHPEPMGQTWSLNQKEYTFNNMDALLYLNVFVAPCI